MNDKRYCLQKLIGYDIKSKMETWIYTNMYSETVGGLENFLTYGYRIFDNKNNIEIKRM